MFCQKCGKENFDDAIMCTGCGASLVKNPVKSKPDNGDTFFEKLNAKYGFLWLGFIISIFIPFINYIGALAAIGLGAYGTVQSEKKGKWIAFIIFGIIALIYIGFMAAYVMDEMGYYY